MKKLETVLKAMDDFSDEEMLAFFDATSDFGQWRSRQVGISGTFLGTAFTYFEGIFQPAVHKAFMDLGDMEKADAAEGKTLLEVSEEAAKTSQEKAEVKADAPKDEAPSEKADAPKEEAPSEVTPTKKTADVKEPPPVKRTASEAMAAPEGDAKMARVEAPLPEPFTLGA